MPLLQTTNLRRNYGDLAVLKGIDLAIEPGEIVSIVGASGAGKTTLLQILGTLDRPDSGELHMAGQNVFALNDRQLARFRNEKIGFVFQFNNLLPEFTALENAASVAGLLLTTQSVIVPSTRRSAVDVPTRATWTSERSPVRAWIHGSGSPSRLRSCGTRR